MVITVHGLHGALSGSSMVIVALAKELIYVGYQVRVNALRVRLQHEPGYDTLVWAEGDFEGDLVPVEV